ncbi:hypothetical protein BLD25_02950 [Candidatus Gracilibacteria bacterium GN02-872]|nr:hypothetical protein BLD25_02950 [Candidatus Gracilibacteria bacterium GN02-872]
MGKMDLESGKDLAKSALTVPTVAVGLSAGGVNTAYIGGQVLGSIQRILETSPIIHTSGANIGLAHLAGVGGAVYLANDIQKKLFNTIGLGDSNIAKYLRYGLNIGAGTIAFSGGLATAPYILGATAAYTLGKPVWNLSKNVVSKTAGTVWGLTGGALVGAVKGAKNGLMNGFTTKPNLN